MDNRRVRPPLAFVGMAGSDLMGPVWVYEETPRQGTKRLEWMLLTDLPIQNAEEAWEKVEWYKIRWGIEEWHRVLKSGCAIEQREFKTAEQLKRVLTFDLIMQRGS